jgi:hypothetical protein
MLIGKIATLWRGHNSRLTPQERSSLQLKPADAMALSGFAYKLCEDKNR